MKRLRIVQQIAVVLFFAVLIPFIVIGLIISNISQQSVRKELNYSASTISQFVGDSVNNYMKYAHEELNQIASAITFFYYEEDKNDFLNEIDKKYNKFTNFKVIPAETAGDTSTVFNPKHSTVKLYTGLNDTQILSAELKVYSFQQTFDEKFKDIKHDIYILDDNENIIATNDPDHKGFKEIVENMPKEREYLTPVLFSKIKNMPYAYYQLQNPNWTVVVKTSPVTTQSSIDKARFRIILSLFLAALFIFIVVGLYTYYLYINIRQLFKGIIAISKGSYDRKIRLLKSLFTPYEIVFLEKEFNYMTKKVSQSYAELSNKNMELKRQDEFRNSLVSAISHEFRTPLTSIIGYTGRLMRQDIQVDDATKNKSLKIIKQQAQRLSRMVDDLLVIPEIESFNLKLNEEELELAKILELCIAYANTTNTEFDVNIAADLLMVKADKDRLIQVLINLCDNAIKYNKDNAPITISAANVDGKPCLSITNKADVIPKEMLTRLFDKFIRIDSELTRTTRGTGLGLYIVKGLCSAMNISVDLISDNDGFQVILVFNQVKENYSDNSGEDKDKDKKEYVELLFDKI